MIHIDPMTLADDEFITRARGMCSEKAAYVNRKEARAFLARRGLRGMVYKCPFCNHYHHTTYTPCKGKAFQKRLRSLL